MADAIDAHETRHAVTLELPSRSTEAAPQAGQERSGAHTHNMFHSYMRQVVDTTSFRARLAHLRRHSAETGESGVAL
jgi:hypothetical protein